MTLRVLSLNVWALPAPFGRDVDARMDEINARLTGLDADIVVYQEVWTAEARAQLIVGGRRSGYTHVWHREAASGGSGLLVLSRVPMGSTFTRYTLSGLPQRFHHADYYGGKGFVQLAIDWHGVPLTLFATHMHARYAPSLEVDEYRGHRIGQVIELAAGVRSIPGPIVAVGDFNQHEYSPEYQVLRGLTHLDDAAVSLGTRQKTTTLSNPYRARRGSKGESRIDYVFTRPGSRHDARPVSVRRVLDEVFDLDGTEVTYSDHAGLLAEIAFDAGGVAPREPEPIAIELARAILSHGRERTRDRRTFERVAAGTSAIAATAAIRYGRRRELTRRRFLRAGLFAGGALGTAATAGFLTLSERYVPDELAGYDTVERMLDSISLRRGASQPDWPSRASLAWLR